MKKCPYCAEEIQDKIRKCNHCGEILMKIDPKPPIRNNAEKTKQKNQEITKIMESKLVKFSIFLLAASAFIFSVSFAYYERGRGEVLRYDIINGGTRTYLLDKFTGKSWRASGTRGWVSLPKE